MANIKCFLAVPTTRVKRFLRRYEDGECSGKYSYHNTQKFFDEIEVPLPEGSRENDELMISGPPDEELEPLFPTLCGCGFAFTENSTLQLNIERLYRNEETGEDFDGLAALPVGAMYFAEWYDSIFQPQLEHVLVVRTPGGLWIIDSESSNCTMPAKDGQKRQSDHHCWIIEGTLPNITVSKNGKTCGAGGGSIQCGNYHGFLRNGYLEEC